MSNDDHIKAMALEADRLRTDPVFAEAIKAMRADAVEELANATPTDADTIRTLQARIRAVDALCGEIAAMITRGKAQRKTGAV